MAFKIQVTRLITPKLPCLRLIHRSLHDSFLADLDKTNKDDVSKLLEKLKFLPTEKHRNSHIIEDSVVIKTPRGQVPYYNSTFGKTRVHPDIKTYTQKLEALLNMNISEVTLRRMSSLTPLTIPPHFDDLSRVGLISTSLFNCRNVISVAGKEFELNTDQALSLDPRLMHSSTSEPINPLILWHREVIICAQL